MLDTRTRNAIAKAVELNGAKRVVRIAYGHYLVKSASSERTYVVKAEGQTYTCDCPAAEFGRPCWHRAAVLIAKVEHASGARVIGPAAAAGAPVATALPGERIRRASATFHLPDGRVLTGTGINLIDAIGNARAAA